MGVLGVGAWGCGVVGGGWGLGVDRKAFGGGGWSW